MTLAQFFKRFRSLCITLLVASFVIFFMLEIAPGDVAAFMMGVDADPQAVEALRQELGLNGSVFSRYFSWLFGMFHGDFGISYTYREPVSSLILERIQMSFVLAIFAFLLSSFIAVPLAAFVAMRRGRKSETVIMNIVQIGVAIPNFWLAILLLSLLSTTFDIFPAGGFPGWSAGVWPAFKALILPSLALALPQAAILTRVLRSSLIDTLDDDYVRTARAKGLSQKQTLWRHAMRNALVPVLPIMGMQFAFLIAGAIVIESVFYLPGLGRLVFQAITQRDLIVVKGVVVILVMMVVVITFLMDVLAMWLDPRIGKERT